MEIINLEYYVSFEVAKLLEQAGFDWLCRGYYDRQILRFNFVWDHNGKGASTQCSAPTLDVAQRWLREVKCLDIVVNRILPIHEMKYSYEYEYTVIAADGIVEATDCYFEEYEEALEAGIKKCLELILEEGE